MTAATRPRAGLAPAVLLALGAACLAAALFLPHRWYQPLPPIGDVPVPPVSGWLLLRWVLALDGLLLAGLGWRGRPFARLGPQERLRLPEAPPAGDVPAWAAWLAFITVLGLGLRLWAIGSSLWLDEITPLLNYRDVSAWQVATNYVSSNNHLLNTLLVKAMTSLFGEVEWAVRLPAVLFGAATIPAAYWVARAVLSQRTSLLVALTLAVSYYHVFYSQDARGYTAYLLAALVASGLFARALQEDRPGLWAAYSLTILFGLASQLITAFVVAAHVLTGAAAAVDIGRRGGTAGPMVRRLLGVFAVTGLLGLHLYVVALPQMYVYMGAVYSDPAAGFNALSAELVRELARGLSAGFGVALALVAAPAALVAIAGARRLLRRNWALVAALALGPALQLAFAVAGNLVVSPRFFLLLLPLGILFAVAGVDAAAAWIAPKLGWGTTGAHRLTVTAVLLAALASTAALPHYYATPKQPYREALAWVNEVRRPGDAVLAIQNAESGVRFYGTRIGWQEGRDFTSVRTVAALDAQVAAHPGSTIWLVVTFPRALRLDLPDLDARIRAGWTEVRRFDATIGDGAVTIWRQSALR